MRKYTALFSLGLVLTAGAAAAAPLPVQEYTGRGTQVYRCAASGGAATWQLLGPDAHLYDASGKVVARHFFGPSWQANDGSEIKAAVVIASASPSGAANAPWLVLQVVSEQGPGVFAQVRMVTRIDTQGGAKPAQACAAGNAGETEKVPYSARYIFYSQVKPLTLSN